MRIRIFIVVSILFAFGCKKPNQYPDEPVIDFKSIYTEQNSIGYDQNIVVLLNFTDGDGDVGYRQPGFNDNIFDDPTSQYYNNYIVKIFEKVNGTWYSGLPWDTIQLGGRMPYLTPQDNHKALKGEIQCDILTPPKVISGIYTRSDTMRFEVFIYDRSLHQSNTITTSEIILHTQ